MPTWQRSYLAGCFAVIGGCLLYLLCDFGTWPMLMYEPYERDWSIGKMAPSSSAMVYPGMLLWGALGALSSGLIVFLVTGYSSTEVKEKHLQIVGAQALTAFVICGSYFMWGLWPF